MCVYTSIHTEKRVNFINISLCVYIYVYSYTNTLTYTNVCFPLPYYGQNCAEKTFCKYFNETNLNLLKLKL